MYNTKIHADMIYIRRRYTSELLSNVTPVRLNQLMDMFLVQGKKSLREFMDHETGKATMKLSKNYEIIIHSGKQVAPRELTFGRLCCILGEIRRSQLSCSLFPRPTGLANHIKLEAGIDSTLKSFLHHGVHFSWDLEANDAPVNKNIYLAIKGLDLIFFNINRLRLGQSPVSRASKLYIIPGDQKTWTQDLVKYIGIDRLELFEKTHREWIRRNLELIQFKVANGLKKDKTQNKIK